MRQMFGLGGGLAACSARAFIYVFTTLTHAHAHAHTMFAHLQRKVETGAGYAAHPDVRSGKRSAEEVEREFLETFAGPTIVAGPQGPGAGAFDAIVFFASGAQSAHLH